MLPNGTSADVTGDMVKPTAEGTPDRHISSNGKSSRPPSKADEVERERQKNEQLLKAQVMLMREKVKWHEKHKLLGSILDSVKHSSGCLDEACRHIRETGDWSVELDDIICVSSVGLNHVKQDTLLSFADNNLEKHGGQLNHSLTTEQESPRENRSFLGNIFVQRDFDSVLSFFDEPFLFINDSQCYTTSPDGRGDPDYLDGSDDSRKSSFSDTVDPHYTDGRDDSRKSSFSENGQFSPNNNFSSKQEVLQHENCPITEQDITNNNYKEHTNFTRFLSIPSPAEDLGYKEDDNDRQCRCIQETTLNRNTKSTFKRPFCTGQIPSNGRRGRKMGKFQSWTRESISKRNAVVESDLVTDKEGTIKSENSKEINPIREISSFDGLHQNLPKDIRTNEGVLTKDNKEERESGITTKDTAEKAPTEENSSQQKCHMNICYVKRDSNVLIITKEGITTDMSNFSRTNEIEPVVTSTKEDGGLSSDALTGEISTAIGKVNPGVENKVTVDNMNNKYQTMTDNLKDKRPTSENIVKSTVLETVVSPEEVPKTFSNDNSERSRLTDSTSRGGVTAEQNIDAGIFIAEKSQIKIATVDANEQEDLTTNDTAIGPSASDDADDEDQAEVCILKEDGIQLSVMNTCGNSNTTGSATEVSQTVKETKVKKVLVNDDCDEYCTFIGEKNTMLNSTRASGRKKGMSTVRYSEEQGSEPGENVKVRATASIGIVELNHTAIFSDKKDKDRKAEDVQYENPKTGGNMRKRASRIVYSIEKPLKTEDSIKERCAAVDNRVEETGISVHIKMTNADKGTDKTISQENKATVSQGSAGIQLTVYRTQWREHLFCIYISLAMLLFVALLSFLSFLNM